jgi:dihydroorotase
MTLSRGGSMNEGIDLHAPGRGGIPNAAEDVGIARDLLLAELTGGRLHVQHVSTRAGVAMIRAAKERGLPSRPRRRRTTSRSPTRPWTSTARTRR